MFERISRQTWWIKAIVIILIALIAGVLLLFGAPVVAGLYLTLFITSWNASVAEIFALPPMSLEQANAFCMLSALVFAPLFFLAALFLRPRKNK